MPTKAFLLKLDYVVGSTLGRGNLGDLMNGLFQLNRVFNVQSRSNQNISLPFYITPKFSLLSIIDQRHEMITI